MRALNILLLALIFSFNRPSLPLVPIAILGLILVRGHDQFKKYIFYFSVLSLLCLPNYAVIYRGINVQDMLGTVANLTSIPLSSGQIFLSRLAALLLALGFYKMTWRLIAKPLWAIAVILPLAVALLELARTGYQMKISAAYFIACLAALISRSMISILLFRQALPRASGAGAESVLIYPFFQTDLPKWDQGVVANAPEVDTRQLSYFLETCGLILVATVCWASKWFLFSSGVTGFNDLQHWGYSIVLNGHSSALELWVNFLFHPLFFIGTTLWVGTNSLTLLFNVMGYRMVNSFNQPWRARSFSDFMSRMFYYYSRCLTCMLYIPLMQRTRALRRFRPLDQLLILFFSIIFFSMIYHMLREYWVFLGPSNDLASTYLKNYLIYSVTLSLLVCLSFVLERKERWRETPFILRFPIYWLCYSVIYYYGAFLRDSAAIKTAALSYLF